MEEFMPAGLWNETLSQKKEQKGKGKRIYPWVLLLGKNSKDFEIHRFIERTP